MQRMARSCWTPSGGVSPLPVSADAPVSRSQVFGGDPFARAGYQKPMARREPCNGEQAHGPQHEVKPAASSQLQSGSRAALITVKATSVPRVSERGTGSGGVGGAARVQGGVRNRRGPSVQPRSRQGEPYKPKVKSEAGQRESEGVVVP